MLFLNNLCVINVSGNVNFWCKQREMSIAKLGGKMTALIILTREEG